MCKARKRKTKNPRGTGIKIPKKKRESYWQMANGLEKSYGNILKKLSKLRLNTNFIEEKFKSILAKVDDRL